MSNDSEISKLIYLFSKLPGLGQRSARRIILHLLQDPEVRLRNIVTALQEVENNVISCTICGNLDNISPCSICTDNKRMKDVVAVVETVADLWAMERSGVYKGYYHILGGSLSAIRGVSPESLRLPALMKRCMELQVQEIIIATNSTVEGQTTAFFITEYLKDCNFHISRLASGIPVGGELDYLDEGTLSAAFTLRQPFEQ